MTSAAAATATASAPFRAEITGPPPRGAAALILSGDRDDASDRFVIPGHPVSTTTGFMRGHGTVTRDGELIATLAGSVQQVNRLITVKPVKSRYNGEVGDVVVGRVVDVQQKRWKVEWSSPDSNYGAYISALPERYHHCVVPVELAEATYRQGGDKFPYDITRTASSYEHRIRQHIGPELIGRMPRFDAVLLGMGPDGHTASLFPNSRLWKLKNYQLDSPSWIVAIDDSPKQPPRRITFTLGAINCAKNIAFIATGEDKATVLKEVLEGNPMFPAALVRPCYNGGTLKFFVDRAAASKIV